MSGEKYFFIISEMLKKDLEEKKIDKDRYNFAIDGLLANYPKYRLRRQQLIIKDDES